MQLHEMHNPYHIHHHVFAPQCIMPLYHCITIPLLNNTDTYKMCAIHSFVSFQNVCHSTFPNVQWGHFVQKFTTKAKMILWKILDILGTLFCTNSEFTEYMINKGTLLYLALLCTAMVWCVHILVLQHPSIYMPFSFLLIKTKKKCWLTSDK